MNGDTVIGKLHYGVSVIVGFIQDINPGCTSCNCTVIRPGGLVQTCCTVGDLYHADDALACIEAEWQKSVEAMATKDGSGCPVKVYEVSAVDAPPSAPADAPGVPTHPGC